VYPYVEGLAQVVLYYGKLFGYSMTTGVERPDLRLADAGVDVPYFVDPLQDALPLHKARDLPSDRMTLVGGTNALTLAQGDADRIHREVQHAPEVLGPTDRFALQPVEARFPDMLWDGVEAMIVAWMAVRRKQIDIRDANRRTSRSTEHPVRGLRRDRVVGLAYVARRYDRRGLTDSSRSETCALCQC
jgi:hypothetical protein